MNHACSSLAGDVAQYGYREDGDDRQRNEIGEREERREDPLPDLIAEFSAFLIGRHAVRAQYRHVDKQNDHPDRCYHDDDVSPSPDANRLYAVHDRHVTYHRDEHQRVNRHVRGDVDQVVEQYADGHAERPRARRLLVGSERRYDYDKTQVGDGEIQQQEIGDRTHRAIRQDDVDDEAVADDTDQGDAREDDWCRHAVEEIDEIARRVGRRIR